MNISFFLEEDQIQASEAVVPLAAMDDWQRREFWACLALRHCAGLGPRKRCKLLNRFGSAFNALENVEDWGRTGIARDIREQVRRGSWREAAGDEWEKALRLSASILMWASPSYPELLRETCDSPLFLYCQGDLQLLQSPCIAIVGSRNASRHSLEVAAHFGKTLSSCGIVVVSGMAVGIDSAAHSAALTNIGKSIGVLGTGIDRIYPFENKYLFKQMAREGLLVSEFAPGMPPIGHNFPVRNRIISGLSLGVVVVEAATRSGSLVTARIAIEQNHEVFAVPGQAMDVHAMGCQNLVRQGATPVFCVDDILRNMEGLLRHYKLKPPQEDALPANSGTQNRRTKGKSKGRSGQLPDCASPPAELRSEDAPPRLAPLQCEAAEKLLSGNKAEQIEQCLREKGTLHIDILADMVGLPPGELNSTLLGLEMFGKIKRLPGARFEAIK